MEERTTVLMELNPKIRNRYLRAFELIPQKNCRLLDLGCLTGGFLGYLHKKACCRELCGCDVSSEAIAEAQDSYPGIKFVHIIFRQKYRFRTPILM